MGSFFLFFLSLTTSKHLFFFQIVFLCNSFSFHHLQSNFTTSNSHSIVVASSRTLSAAAAAPGRPLQTAATAPGAGAGSDTSAARRGALSGSHSCGSTSARR